ncbi:3390_t:CDS:2 [Dentiscutata heterogama]|uniref:3390_t:CDS:1 n=1 Tax=Dentiscutata heterogama TaxID=1316150 RepID=A0ACA9K8I7_9GLOM|nr:3390_t:CDS:2 [Dentiscutata heterogama]
MEQTISNNNIDRPFPTLPNEITLLILSYLNQQTRIKILRVSKAFRNIIYSSILWHEAIIYNSRGFGNEALEILKKVHSLSARASGLDDEFVRKLAMGPPGQSLRVLDLSVNDITDKTVFYIGNNCPNLQKLFLEGCDEITNIKPLIKLSSHLNTLILSYCSELLDFTIADLISSVFGENLSKLDLDGCHRLTDVSIYRISCYLKNLEYLAIDGQGINDDPIINVFRNCRKLILFSMSFCDSLTDNCLYNIVLNINPCLKFLRLRKGLGFTDEGFHYFFKGLSLKNHSFYYLDLSECSYLSDMALQQMSHDNICWLNLDWCWNVKESSILTILTSCPNIQELMVTGCNDITCESIIGKKFLNLKVLNLLSCRAVEPITLQAISELNKNAYIIDYYGEVYKNGKKIGFHEEIYIDGEDVEWMVGGRERRCGLLHVGHFLRFFKGYSI